MRLRVTSPVPSLGLWLLDYEMGSDSGLSRGLFSSDCQPVVPSFYLPDLSHLETSGY